MSYTPEQQRALEELQEIDAKLEKLRVGPQSGAAQAFSEPIPVGPNKPGVTIPVQNNYEKLAEGGAMILSTMKGATLGAKAVEPIASKIPNRMGQNIVRGGGAALGAAFTGAAVEGTMDTVKSAMGLPGAPDSIDASFQNVKDAFVEQGMGEVYGRTIIGGITTAATPFRRAMDPETAGLMTTMANRVRAAYEEIGGAKLVEDVRPWWSPGRVLWPAETELAKGNPVYDRLRKAGLEPEVARKVAITGGAVPTRLDSSVTGRFWGMATKSSMIADEAYERARAKLLMASSLDDLGTKFADQLPPEEMAKAVIGAVNGQFDTLNGARKTAMTAFEKKLPADYKIDVSKLRQAYGATVSVKGPGGMNIQGFPGGPGARRPGAKLILGLPDQVSFKALDAQRDALSTMSKDMNLSEVERLGIDAQVRELDNFVHDALPGVRLKRLYRKFAIEDRAKNKFDFDGTFVGGMLHRKYNIEKVAESIVDNKDVGSFLQLEHIIKAHPNGKVIMGQMRGAMADRFFAGAINKHGILDPSTLEAAMGTQTLGYGKYFLESTLGPSYVDNLGRYIKAMKTIDDAVAKAGGSLRAATTLTGVALGMSGLVRGPAVMNTTIGGTIAAALFSPAMVSKLLTHPTASRLLVRAAENVAVGRNPRTTARILSRAMEMAGVAPEDAFPDEMMYPSQQISQQVQRESRPMLGTPLPPATGMGSGKRITPSM